MGNGTNQTPEPLTVPPAYSVVVSHLRRQIHLGAYAPGDKLPPERTLAPQLGVSRVTLREAIRVLEAEGYVTTRRGATGGVTVRERTESPAELRARARAQRDQIEALLEFRLANERLAAERAAGRITKEELAELEETIATLRSSDGVGPFRQADSKFHLLIASAADCDVLRDAVEEARAQLFLPLDAIGYEILTESTIRGHVKIFEALRAGDAAAAGRAMARHLAVTSGEIDSMLEAE